MSLNIIPPLSSPLEREWPVLWQLRDRLGELGYSEHNVSRAMGVRDHSIRDYGQWPAHLRNCQRGKETNPAALLAAFFLIEELVAEEELVSLLGADAVKLMHGLKWVETHLGKLHFRFYLYPLLGALFLTDGFTSNPNHHNQVYPLGADSHTLARLAPRPQGLASLDHCTGSGIHAVLSGGHCQRSFGLDINPRALQFSRFNARWNGLENVRFLESDCYQNVQPDLLRMEAPCRFDLITANPPFVPTPQAISLCRGGGPSGEEVTEKIVRGLPGFLSQQGLFSMITNVPIFAGQTFFERCETWLDSDHTWSVLVLTNHTWTVPAYIQSHHTSGDYETMFRLWLDSYESVGLEAVTSSQVYAFRSSHPWRIERYFGYPDASVSLFIERWIASLRAYQPDSSARYRLHPGLDKVLWVDNRSRAYLEWKSEYEWWQTRGVWLDGAAALALAGFEGQEKGIVLAGLDIESVTRLLSDHLVTLVIDPLDEGEEHQSEPS